MSNFTVDERARIKFSRCAMRLIGNASLGVDTFSGREPYWTCEDEPSWVGGRLLGTDAQRRCSDVNHQLCELAAVTNCDVEPNRSTSALCDYATGTSAHEACCGCGGGLNRRVMNGSWVDGDFCELECAPGYTQSNFRPFQCSGLCFSCCWTCFFLIAL